MINPLGIDHAAINVVNLDESMKFYTEIIGLKISEREYQKPGIEYFLDCGSSLIGLIQADNSKEVHKLQEGGPGGNHVSFRVHAKDFDSKIDFMKSKNVHVDYFKKRERSWSCYFKDPDGNKLEMTAWPIEDGVSSVS